jgi:hypothetical protein
VTVDHMWGRPHDLPVCYKKTIGKPALLKRYLAPCSDPNRLGGNAEGCKKIKIVIVCCCAGASKLVEKQLMACGCCSWQGQCCVQAEASSAHLVRSHKLRNASRHCLVHGICSPLAALNVRRLVCPVGHKLPRVQAHLVCRGRRCTNKACIHHIIIV